MKRPGPSVRVHGEGPLVARLAAIFREAGLPVVDAGPEVEVVTAPGMPVSTRPLVRVAAADDLEALSALAAGTVADVVSPDAPAAELVARVRRAARGFGGSEGAFHAEMDAQLALIRDLATSADLPVLLLRIVRHLAGAVGVERCSLVLVDGPEATRGTVVASSDRTEVQQLPIDLADYPEIREARRTGAPVIVADTAHHPLLGPVRSRLEKAGVGAVACFPLHVDHRFLGVLMMRARTPFSDASDLRAASTAALATAIAVRHAGLVEEARHAASREMARHEAFVSQLSDGVAVLGQGHEVLLLNPAGAAILGVTGDARGRRFFDLAPPSADLSGQLLAREISRGARVLSADLEVMLPESRRAVLAVSAGPLRGGDEGKAILSFRDVTEQRSVESELRRTRDFLERLIDASGDAIVAADLEGRILVFNRAAEKLFGVTAAEARQRVKARDLYPDAGARQVMRMLRSAPQGQIEAVRCFVRDHAGDEIPIELSAALIRAAGHEEASVGVMRDLRERVRVEGELAQTRSQLIDAEKQRTVTALAGATAHELNQPLTVIIGYVELLRRRIADEALRKPLDIIGAEAERMAQIVRKVAKLTRIETMAYPGERQIADLDRSVQAPPATPPVRR